MKIGFVNFSSLVYTVDTPYEKSLGGSESSLCYLAEHLAKRGHEVILFVDIDREMRSRGVLHVPKSQMDTGVLQDLDVLVVQNTPLQGPGLKALLSPRTKLVLWTGHAPDQPAVSCLSDLGIQQIFDVFIMVSRVQMENMINTYHLDRKKCWILRNAIAPAFENLFTKGEDILSKKNVPATLAYNSTPFRGLDFLLAMFPSIRNVVPDVKLEVYSDMKVYQTPSTEEESSFGELYRLCRETAGVSYIGTLSQPELSKKLKKVLILSYPNTFSETSCIAVMEAMASGCLVVTSNLGAMAETTAGFAKLIEMTDDWRAYGGVFIGEIVKLLRENHSGEHNRLNDLLNRQVAYANRCYTWTVRAGEWESWLTNLVENGA